MGFGNADVDAFESSLVSVWKMDETSGTRFDSFGSNDLTDVNTVGSASGKDGNAADFIRANSECLSFASGVSDTSGDMAISLWFNADDTTNGYIHAQYDLPGGFDAITINFSGGTLSCFFGSVIVSKTGLSTGSFIHTVFIRDGSTVYLFVDGVQEDSIATGTIRVADNLRIGCRDFGSGNATFFDGLIDENDLWNGPSFGGGNPTRQNFVDGLFNGGDGNFFAPAVFRAEAASRKASPIDKYPVPWRVW